MSERPWARVKNPPTLPARREDTETLLRQASDHDFAELIRAHLLPGRDNRQAWNQLWLALDSDEFADRLFDLLETWLDMVDQAPDAEDATQANRREKFRQRVDDAWGRLTAADDGQPLGWAGRAGRGFNPPARRVIETLVTAIDQHRQDTLASSAPSDQDSRLWQTLQQVDLDPVKHSRRR